jgi:hypothetical protein
VETTIFDKAIELTRQHPFPVDIVATLNKMESQITKESEKKAFAWIYEGVYLELNDTCSESYKLLMDEMIKKARIT